MVGFPVDALLDGVIACYAGFLVPVIIHIVDDDTSRKFAVFQLIRSVNSDHTAHIGDMLAAAGHVDVIGRSASDNALLCACAAARLDGNGDIQTIRLRRFFTKGNGIELDGGAVREDNLKAVGVVCRIIHCFGDLFYHIRRNFNRVDALIQAGEVNGDGAGLHIIADDGIQMVKVYIIHRCFAAGYGNVHMDGVLIARDGDSDFLDRRCIAAGAVGGSIPDGQCTVCRSDSVIGVAGRGGDHDIICTGSGGVRSDRLPVLLIHHRNGCEFQRVAAHKAGDGVVSVQRGAGEVGCRAAHIDALILLLYGDGLRVDLEGVVQRIDGAV